jgi:hypothetical protein
MNRDEATEANLTGLQLAVMQVLWERGARHAAPIIS